MFKGNHNFDVNSSDIRIVMAILLLSGYNSVPRNCLYWDSDIDTYHHGVTNATSSNRFEEVLRYFHVYNKNNLNPLDKFCKICPLWDHLNSIYNSIQKMRI